jgi:hypothetical protein
MMPRHKSIRRPSRRTGRDLRPWLPLLSMILKAAVAIVRAVIDGHSPS